MKNSSSKIVSLLLLGFISVNAETYNPTKAVEYANKYSSTCNKMACTEKWNTKDYPGSEIYDNKHSSGTHV